MGCYDKEVLKRKTIMPRSLEEIGSKYVKDLRDESAALFKKHQIPFIGKEGREYNASKIESHGTRNECIEYISLVENTLEAKKVKVAKKPIAVEPTTKTKAVEPTTKTKAVEPIPVETPNNLPQYKDTPTYTHSETEKLEVAKLLYEAKEKNNGFVGLKQYHYNLCKANKLFTPDFAILIARARLLIEDYAHQKSFSGQAHPGSIQKIRLEIVRLIEEMVQVDNDKFIHPSNVSLIDTYTQFEESVKGAFRDIGAQKHQLNQRMNQKNELDVREIEAYPFVEWAVNRITNLPPLPSGNASEDRRNGANWKEIAIALMLLTGRRQSEIMSSGIFTFSSNTRLIFEGQLKRHVDELVEPKKIPVLGKSAKQILKAIEWLDAYGKRVLPEVREYKALQAAAKKAHDSHSRYIAETMDNLSKYCKITNQKTWEYMEEGKERSKFKGHLCRQIYAEICASLYHDDSETKKRTFISQILIESNSSATLPYDRDIKIKDIDRLKELCGTFKLPT